jgi:DNA-binding transcriptional regulator YdaS (Cro superfamily)
MKAFLDYLNSLPEAERDPLCAVVGTSYGYVRKATSAQQKPEPMRCVDIERATDGAVTRRELRPDDWQRIWPELVAKQRRVAA